MGVSLACHSSHSWASLSLRSRTWVSTEKFRISAKSDKNGFKNISNSPENPIALIATDVDGTLLDSKQKLSVRAERAIRTAVDNGIQVIIATGKAKGPWVADILPRLRLKSPSVFLQGLLIYDSNWEVIYEKKMEDDIAAEVIQIAKEEGLTHMMYSNDRILCEDVDHHTNRMIGYGEPIPEAVGPLRDILGSVPVHKLMYASTDPILDNLRPKLESRLSGRATIVRALNGFLEILPPGASKGSGVQRVLDCLGLDPKNIMAVGDGENDIEMLQLAGFGVAMGNASDKVRQSAQYVTDTNDNDGLAKAIEQFVL